MDVIEEHLTPAGSKIVRVIAANKILADFIAYPGGGVKAESSLAECGLADSWYLF